MSKIRKIGNAPNPLKVTLNIWQTKVSCIHKVSTPKDQRTKFWSVLLYDQLFLRYMDVENRKSRKCTEWPQNDFEHLRVKGTLCTLSTLPLRPKILMRFAVRPAVSRYKVGENRKNRKHTELSQTELEPLTVKGILYALSTYPGVQTLVRFALWPAVFEMQGCRKLEKIENAPIGLRTTLET